MSSGKNIAIVGGGISGLTIAYQLEKILPDHSITLFEASDRVGGKIMSENDYGLIIERGAESVLARKSAVVELIDELGLSPNIIERIPEYNKTFIYSGGILHLLPTGMSGLIPQDMSALENSTLLSKEGILRFEQEASIPPRNGDADESVASFATRRFGKEMYEKIIEPMLSGIYGGDGGKLSIVAIFPQLREYEAKYGSVHAGMRNNNTTSTSRYRSFISLDKGMGLLTDTLLTSLTRTKIILNSPVSDARKSGNMYILSGDKQQLGVFDTLILTTPAYINQRILKNIDTTLAQLHETIPYSSSTVVTCIYDKALGVMLDGYGHITSRGEQSIIRATTWSSHKWPNRKKENIFQLRAFLGGSGDAMVNESEEKIMSLVNNELEKILGIKQLPNAYRIDRYLDAMPQYLVGHNELVSKIEEATNKHSGLYLTGMTYHGVGIPDCIKSANQIASAIAENYT